MNRNILKSETNTHNFSDDDFTNPSGSSICLRFTCNRFRDNLFVHQLSVCSNKSARSVFFGFLVRILLMIEPIDGRCAEG